MLDCKLPVDSTLGRCERDEMAIADEQIVPLGLFCGQPTPRLYDVVIEAFAVRPTCSHTSDRSPVRDRNSLTRPKMAGSCVTVEVNWTYGIAPQRDRLQQSSL